jgi:hypothetical protein
MGLVSLFILAKKHKRRSNLRPEQKHMNKRTRNIWPITSVVLGTPFLMLAAYLTLCACVLYFGLVRGREILPLSHLAPTESLNA